MSDPSSLSWYDLMGVVVEAAIVWGLIALVLKIAEWVSSVRDQLRERYLGGGWEPATIDIMGVPLWCVLKLSASRRCSWSAC